jgi:benzil reductase ((S)-benzoin forming)
MHYYFITGASRGLGKALAEELLVDSRTVVWGVSRHATIQHPRYHHFVLDLADIGAVEASFSQLFQLFPDAQQLTLINNAGILGNIGYVGQSDAAASLAEVYHVNVLAPALLLSAFLTAYAQRKTPLKVLNISSGAARRPLDGWAAYCSSKAAIDMLTQTVAAEQALLGNEHIRLHALSPGVFDTEMQAQIRATDVASFSQVQQFRELYTTGDLPTAEYVAQKIVSFLNRDKKWDGVVVNLREISE